MREAGAGSSETEVPCALFTLRPLALPVCPALYVSPDSSAFEPTGGP